MPDATPTPTQGPAPDPPIQVDAPSPGLLRTLSWTSGLLVLTTAGLLLGSVGDDPRPARPRLAGLGRPTLVVGAHLAISILRDLREGRAGVDVIALLAIGGALLLGETFAAAVIGVMLATGRALEAYAEGRARRELTALLGRAPQVVHRYVGGGAAAAPAGTTESGATPGPGTAPEPGTAPGARRGPRARCGARVRRDP
ncbi:MAG: hypothetical protein KatS3mg065_0277 [Chloroflexota bacterium]|nr:MAG: hypothetical protein KatS3mg065_0277 [Chloroflexota bacterium]